MDRLAASPAPDETVIVAPAPIIADAWRSAADRSGLPRLLVIDMTPAGSGSVTGEVKASLLSSWRPHELLQVASRGRDRLALVQRRGAGFAEQDLPEAEIRAAIEAFAPEAVLYRPVADLPHLHDLAMTLIAGSDLPLVTWIMDDWPARLQATDPARLAGMDADLRWLLARSALRLSISEAMSQAFVERYGLPFRAFANGVDPAEWPVPHRHRPGPLLLRYAGGIAPDMGAESLARLARAVAARRGVGQEIRLEISTNEHWKKLSGALFEGLDGTTLDTTHRARPDYVRWLSEADVLAIAYNFDAASRRYVQYSLANKMPECLASGAAVLAHGPRDTATVAYLAGAGVAEIADQPDETALAAALERLADPDHRQALAERGRALALSRHALPRLAADLAAAIAGATAPVGTRPAVRFQSAADPGTPLPAEPGALRNALARGEALRLVWDDPRHRIAAAIASGRDPAPVLAGWAAEAEAALACYRPLRARVRVVAAAGAGDAESVPQNPDPAKGDPPFPPAQACAPAPDPALWPLTELWLRRNRTAQRLLAELEASGLGADDSGTGVAPDRLALAATAVHQARGTATALAAAAADARRQGADLRRLLAQARAEARTASGELAGQREARREAKATAARLDKEAAGLRDSLGAAEAAAADLRRQLDQSRAEAETTAEDLTGQREARATAEARAARLDREAATAQSHLAEARAALGDALQAAEASRRKVAALAAERDRDRKALATARAEAAAADARAAEARRDAEAERARFYTSWSWRLMAPLRGVRRLFGPRGGPAS